MFILLLFPFFEMAVINGISILIGKPDSGFTIDFLNIWQWAVSLWNNIIYIGQEVSIVKRIISPLLAILGIITTLLACRFFKARKESYCSKHPIENKGIWNFLLSIIKWLYYGILIVYLIYSLYDPQDAYSKIRAIYMAIFTLVDAYLGLSIINTSTDLIFGFKVFGRCMLIIAVYALILALICIIHRIFSKQPVLPPPTPISEGAAPNPINTEGVHGDRSLIKAVKDYIIDNLYKIIKVKNIKHIVGAVVSSILALGSLVNPKESAGVFLEVISIAKEFLKSVLFTESIETVPINNEYFRFLNVISRIILAFAEFAVFIAGWVFIQFIYFKLTNAFNNSKKNALNSHKTTTSNEHKWFSKSFTIIVWTIILLTTFGISTYLAFVALSGNSALKDKWYEPFVYIAVISVVIIGFFFLISIIIIINDVICETDVLKRDSSFSKKLNRFFGKLRESSLKILTAAPATLKAVGDSFLAFLDAIVTIIKPILKIFKGYKTETAKNRVLLLSASLTSLSSMATTFFGLFTFMNSRNGGNSSAIMNAVLSFLITAGIQFCMLIIGMKIGESLKEWKEIRHAFPEKSKTRRSRTLPYMLCFAPLLLISSIFSFVALFSNLASASNLRRTMYSNVINEAKNLSYGDIDALNNSYKHNNNEMDTSINGIKKVIAPNKASLPEFIEKTNKEHLTGKDDLYKANFIGGEKFKLNTVIDELVELEAGLKYVMSANNADIKDKYLRTNVFTCIFFGKNPDGTHYQNISFTMKQFDLCESASLIDPTKPFSYTPIVTFNKCLLIKFDSNTNDFIRYDGTANPTEMKGYIVIDSSNRGMSVLPGKAIKLKDKYELLNILFIEYVNLASLLIDSNGSFETQLNDFSTALLDNKKITDAVNSLTDDNNTELSTLKNLVVETTNDILAETKTDNNEVFNQYDTALQSIIDVLEKLPLSTDSGDSSLKTIAKYRNYMQTSLSDLGFSLDILLKGAFFNSYTNSLKEVYQAWLLAFGFALIAVILDITSIIVGLFLDKTVYSLELNSKILDLGYLRYDAELIKFFKAPKSEERRKEMRLSVISLMRDTEFSDTAFICTLRKQFAIDIQAAPKPKQVAFEPHTEATENLTSLESFRVWLTDYINHNRVMFEDWDEYDAEADILSKVAQENNKEPRKLSKLLREGFLEIDGRFDYENSLLMEIDNNVCTSEESNGLSLINADLNSLSPKARTQLEWLRSFKGFIDVSKMNEGHINISATAILWMRHLRRISKAVEVDKPIPSPEELDVVTEPTVIDDKSKTISAD